MNQLEIEATVGRLYMSLVEANSMNAQLAELYRQAVAPKDEPRPENVTGLNESEPT